MYPRRVDFSDFVSQSDVRSGSRPSDDDTMSTGSAVSSFSTVSLNPTSHPGDRFKEEFEKLKVGDVIEKDTTEDRRVQVELHGIENMGPAIKD